MGLGLCLLFIFGDFIYFARERKKLEKLRREQEKILEGLRTIAPKLVVAYLEGWIDDSWESRQLVENLVAGPEDPEEQEKK